MIDRIEQFRVLPTGCCTGQGFHPIFQNTDFELWQIVDHRAAKTCSDGTAWCLLERDCFDWYLKQGPIFYIYSHKREASYILSPETREFKNQRNRSKSLTDFVNSHQSAFYQLARLHIHGSLEQGAKLVCYHRKWSPPLILTWDE